MSKNVEDLVSELRGCSVPVRSCDPFQVWESHPVVSKYLHLKDRQIAAAIDEASVPLSEPKFIKLDTYRKKGINAYLVGCDANGKALSHEKNMYGAPVSGQEELAHKSKKHTVQVRIDNLPDGKYIYKEAGGADFNKSRHGWIVLKNGEIVEEG